ncbi:NAD(P)-dependent oxidoreductase [Sphaerisporangium album]|uniref:NAD(P)-dependent oxidoreductase n=1 Tax=Sphaerisporangium album TaxID=509200 RepID=A0A367FC64_9ACTN|nr:NAD(P)-dependent oxidoreductase [Sphaerisporangium album]RCG27287.1 NAD(P)-dependent oxidoreductase [Sphaerisporangium album]
MSTIAFLGQGRMGVPMARRLVDAGHRVTVWNRTPEKCAWAADAGAHIAGTPAEAARDADLVITMLRDADAVGGVLLGEKGAGQDMAPGTVVLEMSTIGPDAVTELRDRLRPGIRLVDAPVVGSLPQATAGKLRILVGGEEADVSRCADVLAVLGSVTHLGPLGSGAAGKLVANMITITSFTMIAEALALGDRLGLTTEDTLGLLGTSAVGPFVERIRDRIGDDEFPTQFSLGLAEKDLALILAAGADPSGLVAAARRHLSAAVHSGLSERDISVVIEEVRSRTASSVTTKRGDIK